MNNWFKEKRFGMFIHWGIYAIPAMHEQYWQRWNIEADKYIKFAGKFNPVDFDPVVWLDLAEEAGMEYICFTAKHHDGFCMWDSAHTDFNIMHTPYKRDILGMLADECHKRDMPLMIYYSVVDWHHPAYPNIGRHHEIVTDSRYHDMDAYMTYLKAQIEELCTKYGIIHGIWWDMNVPEHSDPSVHEMIRRLQPQAVINNRGFDEGDFATPERDFDPEGANVHSGVDYKMIEACQSVGVNSWGYRMNEDYFSSSYFMSNIDSWLAKGCNYLLNVGPDADGNIPMQAVDILRNIGKWFKPIRESFDGVSERCLNDSDLLTVRNDNVLYVHCPAGLVSSTISLAPLKDIPESIVLLNDNSFLTWSDEPLLYEQEQTVGYIRVCEIPVDKLTGPAVIKITFKS